CDWESCYAGLHRAAQLAEESGDMRLWAECRAQLGATALFSSSFARGLEPFRDARQLGRRSGNAQAECWGLMGETDCLLRLGRNQEAMALYDAAAALIDEAALKTEAIWTHGMLGLARLRTGNAAGAYEAAARALSNLREAPPVAFWTQQGIAATTEVFLLLCEKRWRFEVDGGTRITNASREACDALRKFAKRFPLGQPHAALWRGLWWWLTGHHARAFRSWRRAIAAAEQLHTGYE